MTEPLGRVAVFWHFDSLPPPCMGGSPREISRSTYDTIFNIRQALYKFGIVTCFRAYLGSMPPQAKWELQSHGVTVVECLWNASETMITADMFRFALDNPSLGTTLVLISSSFTLAYTISVLGARRYRVALLSIPDQQNNVLLAQASEVINWHYILSRRRSGHPPPVTFPRAAPNSSEGSSPEHPVEVDHNTHAGPDTGFPHNTAETFEGSFTISDLNFTGNSGGQSASPPTHLNAAQLELLRPPPVDSRPPSREIEEAILNNPATEPAGGQVSPQSGPRCSDSSGQSIEPSTRPFNRTVSELARGRGTSVGRQRTKSLQHDRHPASTTGIFDPEDPIVTRSLPLPPTMPFLIEQSVSTKPLNVEAPPFIPSSGSITPPSTDPSENEDALTTISSPTKDTKPTTEGVLSSSPPFERKHSSSSTSPPSLSAPSAVGSSALPVHTTKPVPSTKQRFSKGERRAVETVINVLLDMKSKCEGRVSSKALPPLILAKDRTVYKCVGHRGNKYRKLIDLGVQMGWLETGPENVWVDIGKGWPEEGGP